MFWLLWLVPAYLGLGLVVIGGVLVSLGEERPEASDCVSALLVGMVFWPLLVWAFFHEGDGR